MSILNIVDEQDKIIGQETRENIHKQGLLHREIHVLIYNKKSEILFQKRSLSKDTNPGLLAISVGGHVENNDDYIKTAIEEIFEETGLVIDKNDLIFLKKVRSKKYDNLTNTINNVIRPVYAFEFNGNLDDLKIEKNESCGFVWRSLKDLLSLTEESKKEFAPQMIDDEYLKIYEMIN